MTAEYVPFCLGLNVLIWKPDTWSLKGQSYSRVSFKHAA